MSLSSPASWAAEMNFQSRYPGGMVVTMICLASSCPNDEGAIHATTPVTVTTATNKSAIRFMVPSLVVRENILGIPGSEYQSLASRLVHDKRPAKFAAIEGRWHDEQPASEVLIALPNEAAETNRYAISVPILGSVIGSMSFT